MSSLSQKFQQRWQGDGGYRDVLVLAFPLILSTSAWTVQQFVDRMFLTWYSPEAIAAAMPAGILNFTVMSFFIGTAGYVSTFIAQYYGAKRYEQVGAALWQGVYLSVIGGLGFLALIPFAEPIFHFIGHDPAVQQCEAIYFKVLCYGAVPGITNAALSSFFSGLGQTWPMFWVNLLATAVNIVFDYAMIFGKWGFAEKGIEGAAIATNLSQYVAMVVYAILLFRRKYNVQYHTLKAWRFQKELFLRLLRFGVPSGVQFFIDVMGITAFIMILGRLGTNSLAASNIAFNINTLAFMPMIGFAIAVSVIVGQHLGSDRPDLAERGVYSGFQITGVYMSMIAAFYVLFPQVILWPYAAQQADAVNFAEIQQIVVVLLRFIAIYSVFDTLNLIFISAVKGAGDTRYAMIIMVILSIFGLTLPSYLALVVFGAGLYTGWTILTIYISAMGFIFLFRFRGGKWKTMRVIEEVPPFAPSRHVESPVADYEL